MFRSGFRARRSAGVVGLGCFVPVQPCQSIRGGSGGEQVATAGADEAEAGGGDLLLNLCGVAGALCLAAQVLKRPLLADDLAGLFKNVFKLLHGSNFLSCFVLW